MDDIKTRIDLLCNTLNAQESLSGLKYKKNNEARENDLVCIFRQTQILLREIQEDAIQQMREGFKL